MESLKELLAKINGNQIEPMDHETEPESSEKEKVPSKEELIKWISSNLNFEDEKLHAWVEQNGWNVHEVEDMIYSLASDHVKECMKEKKNGKE